MATASSQSDIVFIILLWFSRIVLWEEKVQIDFDFLTSSWNLEKNKIIDVNYMYNDEFINFSACER